MLDECVDNILAQVRLLRQIASEFSSFASSPTPRPEPTSLGDLVREVVDAVPNRSRRPRGLELELPDTLPLLIDGKTILARALTNIIENALHAMPGGGTLTLDARAADAQHVELRDHRHRRRHGPRRRSTGSSNPTSPPRRAAPASG